MKLSTLRERGRYQNIGIIIGVIVVGGLLYHYFFLQYENRNLNSTLKNNAQDIAQLQTTVSDLQTNLANITHERNHVLSLLTTEQLRSTNYLNQLGEVSTEAERLRKLSETDDELLKKYSRVFFLSENYTPLSLTEIDTKYLSLKDRPLQVHDSVWPFLRDMLEAARGAGLNLQVASAFRSFDTQTSLKSQYKVIYGAGTANQFSADQGYSEHQLGTTVDLTSPETSRSLDGFQNTAEYRWLQNNAHRFGFILSYPPNNSYYQFEPWHWRFVGVKLATKLFYENKNFYDLDQREIDGYLLDLFTKTTQSATSTTP